MKKSIFFLLIYLTKFLIYKGNECNKSYPILKEKQCVLIYCTEEEYNEGICNKNNSIVRAQWLNNIIQVGDKNYRYLNFITTSKNETFFETTAHPETNERIFFGIKQDGSPYFEDSDGNKNYIINKTINKYMYEAPAGYIKINSDDINYKDKEYIITIGKATTDTEIFNFNNLNEDIQIISTSTMIGFTSQTYISSIINIKEDNNNYSIFPLIKECSSNYYFLLTKFNFKIDSGSSNITYSKIVSSDQYDTLDKRIIS